MILKHPNELARERQSIANMTMEDAIFYRFLCPICGKSKPIAGREARGWKRGFRCAECKEKRDARIAEKRMAA